MHEIYIGDSEDRVTPLGAMNGTRFVPANTILILVRGMMLKRRIPVGITTKSVTFNQDVKALIPKAGIDPTFLLNWVIGNENRLLDLVEESSHGTGKLPSEVLYNVEVKLPPLPEQRAIAAILSTWDEAITLTTRLIDALKRRKAALMQLLLTGEVRFSEFDGEWEEVILEDVAYINPPKPNVADGEQLVSFVGMADVSEDARLVNAINRKYVEVKNGFTGFQDQDVLIAKITPCFENGKGALVDGLRGGIGFGSTEFHVARAILDRTTPNFIYYHTLTHRFRSFGESNMSGSAGQRRVPTEFIKSFLITLPSLSEQHRIINVLRQCDTEIDLLGEILAKLTTQKRGLMQQLLTGAVRVQVDKEI